MEHFCFVHAADLHVDTPFTGIDRVPPPLADVLRDASLDAWEALVKLTIARGAACLLLAGDLYDGLGRGVRGQVRLRDGLERLAQRGIQVFIVLGNHDPLEDWLAERDWPPGVTVFGPGRVESVPVVHGGVRLGTAHGVSYARRDCAQNLAHRFRRGAERGLHIGLLHCNVGENRDHAACSPCTVEDLRAAGMDYWALGHVHQRAYLGTGDPWIVYPGNLQGRDTATWERGEKGAVVVEVERGEVRRVDFEALDRVRFTTLELDVPEASDVTAVRRLLIERAARLRDEHSGVHLLVEATLGEQPHFQRAPLRFDCGGALLDELRRETAQWSPFVWWTAIGFRRCATSVCEAVRRRDDLAGELLRWRERLADDPDACSRFLERCFEPLLQKWVAEIEPHEVEGLLRDAEELAVDLLVGGRVP